MGKISLLVSREEMLHQAHNIMQERKYPVDEMLVIRTEETVARARECIAAGSSILIARGLQASLIRQYTTVPVVEIVLTAQEMALLIIKAKKILRRAKPVIAVVGFKNMFCDMSYFNEIYEIELRCYFAEKPEDLAAVTQQALEEHAELIIGGDTAVGVAGRAGIPSLFIASTEDCIGNAFHVAESMQYAMEQEEKNAAQLEAILDTSFSGVIKTDEKALIRVLNRAMADMLGVEADALLDRPLTQVFADIDAQSVERLLAGEEDSQAYFLKHAQCAFYGILTPIRVGESTDGLILSCYRLQAARAVGGPEEERRQTLKYRKGWIAPVHFESISARSACMRQLLHEARLLALSDSPLLLLGETGTEYSLLAQCIHNHGLRAEQPFAEFDCAAVAPSVQQERLFGERGLLAQMERGSLFIDNIECMGAEVQAQLLSFMLHRQLGQRRLDIRVLLGAHTPLAVLAQRGSISQSFYYHLQGLCLTVPPLRERPEDLEALLEQSLRQLRERYGCFHTLTKGAREQLLSYPWPGNILQLKSFCERLLLTAERRSLDEVDVSSLLQRLYAPLWPEERERTAASPQSGGGGHSGEEAAALLAELDRQGGNRERTAAALGISQVTLWRRMKKLGLRYKRAPKQRQGGESGPLC